VFLCVSVCMYISKSYERILRNFFGWLRRRPRNNRLDFGGDVDHDPEFRIQEFLKDSLFTVAIPIESLARIKHEHPWRRFVFY